MSESTVRGTRLTRRQLSLRGLIGLVVGALLLVLALTLPVSPSLRLALVIATVIALYLGVDRLLWAARRRRTDLLVFLCAVWVVGLGLAALLAPLLPLGEASDVAKTLVDPTYVPPFTDAKYPLGTNGSGLDMLARVIYGARASMVISLGAVLTGLVVGGVIGIVAGFYRGGIDSVIGVVTNAVLAVPPLILLVVLASVLEPKIRNMTFALALLTIPTMVRLARANTIAFSQRGFVLAAHAIGASRIRIMLRELLPNVLPPMLSLAVVVISVLIVAEASLSFLGLGIPPPEPTWGNMISEAQAGNTMTEHPFVLLVPGTFLFLTVFAFNLLGERAQKRWDPRGGKL